MFMKLSNICITFLPLSCLTLLEIMQPNKLIGCSILLKHDLKGLKLSKAFMDLQKSCPRMLSVFTTGTGPFNIAPYLDLVGLIAIAIALSVVPPPSLMLNSR